MANLKLLKNKVLVTGANGLLGQKIVEAFIDGFEIHAADLKNSPGVEIETIDYITCDITKRDDIRKLLRKIKPNFVINTAAYTNVDGCEDDKENCWKVNVMGVENLAHAARAVKALFIHLSTDYIFDGVDGNYCEESKPNPLGYYGRAKLAGENAIILSRVEYALIRTMILFGTGKNVRPNFATWLVAKLSRGEPVNIVDDQLGHPTLVDDLAMAIRKIVEFNKTGIFHIVGSDCVSRFEFAIKLAEVFGFDQTLIKPIKTLDLPQKAIRPINSSFNIGKARKELGVEMSSIEKGLKIFKKQIDNP